MLGAEKVLVEGPDLAQRLKAATGAKIKQAVDAVAGATFGRLSPIILRGTSVGKPWAKL